MRKSKKNEKKYYKYLDIIRIFFCISILLYHFGILKNGFLAVCSFFTLSGYLTTISFLKNDSIKLKDYYINRLKKIYIPLLIVVFITIPVISLFKSIIWLNLKPEVTSIIFNYNNFWQLSVNMDYFAQHIDSPFMHLWYVSILIQFDLIFPIIGIIIKKLKEKTKKFIPIILMSVLTIISFLYLYNINQSGDIMNAYYHTFTRVFSLLIGVTLGIIHIYYKTLIPKLFDNNLYRKVIIYIYLVILLILFSIIKFTNIYLPVIMLITSIITCRLIDYSIFTKKLSKPNKLVKTLSNISYEIYLVQYPLIYIFQYININSILKYFLIIILLLLISYIIHFIITEKNKFKIFRIIVSSIIIIVMIIGLYYYIKAKDHTSEMNALKDQLALNEAIINEKKEEYEKKLKEEQEEINKKLQELENGESNLGNYVSSLPIVGVGDSVMLGAVPNLYEKFQNSYFDAKISRTAWVLDGILQDLKKQDMLKDVIILNLGANGDCSDACKKQIMQTCDNRKVFWVNVTNDASVHVNGKLNKFADNYDNLYIIDWNGISKGHPEYFVADGIHLTSQGRIAYVNAIYDSIYNVYLSSYRAQKEEFIKQNEIEQKKKISFYGNDILINAFDIIQSNFPSSKFVTNKFDYETLINELNSAIKDNSLTYKIVFTFDNTLNLSLDEYKTILDLCKGHEVYITTLDKESKSFISSLNYDYVNILDFSDELKNNSGYLMADKIHLTALGNEAFSNLLFSSLKK